MRGIFKLIFINYFLIFLCYYIMARQRSYRRSHSRSRKRARTQHGGDLAGNPASSWGWGLGTVGNGWTQFMNAMTLQPGQNLATAQGTQLVPVNNINANNANSSIRYLQKNVA